jgi:hypothetical protein
VRKLVEYPWNREIAFHQDQALELGFAGGIFAAMFQDWINEFPIVPKRLYICIHFLRIIISEVVQQIGAVTHYSEQWESTGNGQRFEILRENLPKENQAGTT